MAKNKTEQLPVNGNEFKTITVRLDDDQRKLLTEISRKPSVAAQTALEVMIWMRRATLHELKGIFSPPEITALVASFNGIDPTWRVMCNPDVFAANTEDAEKYEKVISNDGANLEELTSKIRNLTVAQATIMQLELWIYWNQDNPSHTSLDKLVASLA
jgi:hypothetical protein